MSFRIEPHPEAFSVLKQRKPRREDRDYLKSIRALPCVITGKRPVEAAHIRMAAKGWGKRETGKAEKPDDRWAIPLHPDLHREQHAMNELEFWKKHGIDCLAVASALWGARDDEEAQLQIILEARRP